MRPGFEHTLFQYLSELQSSSGKSQVFFPFLTDLRLVIHPGSLASFAKLPHPMSSTTCLGSSLTKLTIRSVFDARADYAGAREFFLSLPTIRELAFGVCFHHDQSVVNVLYDILSVPALSVGIREAVLPKLEVLALDIDYGFGEEKFPPGWALDPMEEMIQSRRKPNGKGSSHRLRKFHLYLASWHTSYEAFAESLESFSEEGFEVRILHGYFW